VRPGIPGYDAVRLLGSRPDAAVYAATELATGVPVALKVWAVPASAAEFLGAYERFAAVARTAQGILPLRNAGLVGDRPWLTTSLCDGSLAGEGPPINGQRLAGDLLPALAALHAAGLVHGAVHPGNVLRDGERYLLGEPRFPHQRAVPDGQAPELLPGQPGTARTDVFAMATTFLSVLPAELPPRVESLLERATSYAPQDRPSDVAALLDALLDALRTRRADDRTLMVTVAGRTTRLTGHGEWIIGRGEDADVDVDARRVSRRHAVIRRAGAAWVVRDLGSKNGLWHHGKRVSSVQIRSADTVVLGGRHGIPVEFVPESENADPAW
jgi:hypothetical protein